MAYGSFENSLTAGTQPLAWRTGALLLMRSSALALSVTLLPAALHAAPKEIVITAFNNNPGGAFPDGNLAFGPNGVLYGTTYSGGQDYVGVVFMLKPPAEKGGVWRETVLHSFTGGADGGYPDIGVVVDATTGAVYGTTSGGGAAACSYGCGVVFQLLPPAAGKAGWTEQVLYSFKGAADGAYADGGLAFGPGGVLYGTTFSGGTGSCGEIKAGGCGVVYELAPPARPGGRWKFAVLYRFLGGNDGANPGDIIPLVSKHGVIFGTTQNGGTSNRGTVFQLAPPARKGGAWAERVIHSFAGGPADGDEPQAGVAFGKNGSLIGTTEFGGSNDDGAVFQLIPPAGPAGAWTPKLLHSFGALPGDGRFPQSAPIVDPVSGAVYGTTTDGGGTSVYFFGAGTVYRLAPQGAAWHETILHGFTGGADGAFSYGSLLLGKSGVLYGMTQDGGRNSLCHGDFDDGCGVAFMLTP